MAKTLSTFIAVMLLSVNAAYSKMPTITFGITEMALKSSQGQFSHKLFAEIFKKLNYKMEVRIYPPVRLVEITKTGKVDGELIRMSKYGINHPYLTRVDEPHFKFSVAAFSKRTDLKIISWSDLENMRLCYRRGVKVVENNIRKIARIEDLHPYDDTLEALKVTQLKRCDVYVGIEFFVDELLRKNSAKIKLNKVKRIMDDAAHMYFGKKFAHLAPKVAKILKEMKASGEYKKIMQKVNNERAD